MLDISSDMVILLAEIPVSSKVPPRPGGLGGAASLAATWSVSFVSSMMAVVEEKIYETSGRFDARGVQELVATIVICRQRCVFTAS